jgi:transcription antitermination factor NusG
MLNCWSHSAHAIFSHVRWFDYYTKTKFTLDTYSYLQSVIKNSSWNGLVSDVYCPMNVPYYRFGKGKRLLLQPSPLMPGIIYVKCRMSPAIADKLDRIPYTQKLRRNEAGLVVPLDERRVAAIEEMREDETKRIDLANKELDSCQEAGGYLKGSAVMITSGVDKGKYGTLRGTSQGKIVVRIATEEGFTKDENFDLSSLVRVARSPEKQLHEMSQKDLIRSVMRKNPDSFVLSTLRDAGILDDILYDEGTTDENEVFN